MPDDSINRVTVYKLKISDFDQLDLANYDQIHASSFRLENTDYLYKLYFLPHAEPKEASWLRLFSSLSLTLDEDKVPKVLFAGFILIIKMIDSFYGLCGGLGHTVLTKQPIEHRFGIVLAQKILSLSELKGLAQKDTSGEVNSLDRVFRTTYNPRGDLNNLRRVLTHIRGKLKPENKLYAVIGKSIKAGNALSVTGKKSFKEIIVFLSHVEQLWQSKDPGGLDIPQLEHIKKKFESDLLEHLEKELVAILANYSTVHKDSLFLDNLDIGYLPDRTEKFELIYSRRSHEVSTYDDVFVQASRILNGLSDDERTSAFRRMNVKVFFDNQQFETFSLYKLICGDIIYQNDVYFLNSGLWYRANAEYVNSLDREIDNIQFIDPTELSLNIWDKLAEIEDEPTYNASHRDLSLLDRKLVFIENEKGGIEFCDLLKVDGEAPVYLIHVKKATGAQLRALFAQGYVSARLYSDSIEFRAKVHSADFGGSADPPITDQTKQALSALDAKLKRNFTVVFAIFDDTPSHRVESNARTTSHYLGGTLTTFAKVDLLSRIVSLRAMGYNVAITRIKPYPTRVPTSVEIG